MKEIVVAVAFLCSLSALANDNRRFFHQTMKPELVAWRDADCNAWSKKIGVFTNDGRIENGIIVDSEATRACEKIGGRLPTRAELNLLKRSFETDSDGYLTPKGRQELYSKLFDMGQDMFWSSSEIPSNPFGPGAYTFFGYSGAIDGAGNNVPEPVFCIGQ